MKLTASSQQIESRLPQSRFYSSSYELCGSYNGFSPITSILCDLAAGYNGDAKVGIAALISRIEIDPAIPEIHRAPFKFKLTDALDDLRGISSESKAARYAATTLFEIYQAIYQ